MSGRCFIMMLSVFLFSFVLTSDLIRGETDVGIKLSHTHMEKTVGDNIVVLCTLDGANNLTWSNDAGNIMESEDLSHHVRAESAPDSLQLKITNLTDTDSGDYTCKGVKNGVYLKDKVKIIVTKQLGLVNPKSEYYTSLGSNVTLTCKPNKDKMQITWKFQNEPINNFTGGIFKKFDNGESIEIFNVTNESLGSYSCRIVELTSGAVINHDMQLKLSTPPTIIPVHKDKVVRALMNTTAQLWCKISAGPRAIIDWYRYDKKIKLSDYKNMRIENTKENESVLKINVTSIKDLGSYVCEAFNERGTTNYTLDLQEGQKSMAPEVHPREEIESGFKFDIHMQDSSLNLTNFKVIYKKKSDNDTVEWSSCDLDIKAQDESPYTLSNLLPNTEYLFKVGACTDPINICEFSEIGEFRTSKIATGTANCLSYNFTLQFFVLLPAFVINFYSRRH